MRDEGLYLEDIVEAADTVAHFLADTDKQRFMGSELLQSAVLCQLLIIGEAAARVSEETRARHPEINWTAVVAFRNFAIHAYFAIDWQRVWDAATIDTVVLGQRIKHVLADEFPEREGEQ